MGETLATDGQRILVIRQGFFPLDPRVRREVTALKSAGYEVDVLCLQGPGDAALEVIDGVTIRRLRVAKPSRGVLAYVWSYGRFIAVATAITAAMHWRRHYRLVQVNTMPDQLVFAALVPKIMGVPVLLDLHETMPEFVATKFGMQMSDAVVRCVGVMEQMSIRFAKFSITCTRQMVEAFVDRGAKGDRIGIVLNSADESVFDPVRHAPRQRVRDRFTLICHGTIEERYGIDTAVRAIRILAESIPEVDLRIIGKGSALEAVKSLARELGVADRVHFSNGFVPVEVLLHEIADADVGIVAMKRDVFRDLTQCNKMYDYISMRKPAAVSRTRSVESYFDPSCFQFFESDDALDLARVVLELYRDPELCARMVERASLVNEAYAWPLQRDIYLGYVAELLRCGSPQTLVSDGRPGYEAAPSVVS